jgi:hypothetical protein
MQCRVLAFAAVVLLVHLVRDFDAAGETVENLRYVYILLGCLPIGNFAKLIDETANVDHTLLFVGGR